MKKFFLPWVFLLTSSVAWSQTLVEFSCTIEGQRITALGTVDKIPLQTVFVRVNKEPKQNGKLEITVSGVWPISFVARAWDSEVKSKEGVTELKSTGFDNSTKDKYEVVDESEFIIRGGKLSTKIEVYKNGRLLVREITTTNSKIDISGVCEKSIKPKNMR